jgi:hypothetical protein
MLTSNYISRKPGTKRSGASYTSLELRAVFNKGRVAQGYDSSEYRFDPCGALMKFSMHGVREAGNFGWEADHIVAVAKGGTDDLSNLQPLQWQNNASKGDGPNTNYCTISLNGDH